MEGMEGNGRNKSSETNKPRIVVQYDDHPTFMVSGLCALVAHQSLVDVAIRCGNQTLQAHKVILAANSPFFRARLESNPETEQIVVSPCLNYVVMKNIIEFIYCGETTILEKNLKYVVAAAKMFQIRGLQAIGSESPDGDETMYIQPPLFINQKPKYSSTVPFPQIPKPKNHTDDDSEFGINTEEDYISELNAIPLRVMNFDDINESMIPLDNKGIDLYEMGNMPQPTERPLCADDINSNSVDIMYKTPAGEYVKVPSEMFRNMRAKEGLPSLPYEGDLPLSMNNNTSSINLAGMDLSQKLPSNSFNELEEFHAEPYHDIDEQDQDQDSIDHDDQVHGDDDEDDSAHLDDVGVHSESYIDRYYADDYQGLEGVSANMKDDLNMLLHFQANGRDFSRDLDRLSSIDTLDDLHTLAPLPRVIAETISDDQADDLSLIIENKDKQYLGDVEEENVLQDDGEDGDCGDVIHDGLIQQFNTMPYYEDLGFGNHLNHLKLEDDYNQDQADSD